MVLVAGLSASHSRLTDVRLARDASPPLSPLASPVDAAVEFLTTHPLFAVVLVGLLGFLMFMYLLVRRTVLGLREGYEEGQQGR